MADQPPLYLDASGNPLTEAPGELDAQGNPLAPAKAPSRLGQAVGAAADVGIGVAKGAARTALSVGQAVHAIPGVTRAVDALYGQPGLSDEAFRQAREAMASTNTSQHVGGGLETAAELALPVARAVKAIPNAIRAGKTFQEVMGAAKNLPIDVQAPGDVALRIQQLAERGASMPMAVRKFLGRITDPSKAPMTYEESRDFASTISRLSANEYARLSPVVGREVAHLRVSLNAANATAAELAGKGAEYASAMKEYAQAMKLRDVFESAMAGAKKTIPWATAGAATYYLMKKIKDVLGEAVEP